MANKSNLRHKHTAFTMLPTKCFGFTLAEVLITLGIIGVVAAMTIPNLIANHQKRATVTKLQRAISVLNQAYRRAYDDVGEATAKEASAMGSEAYFNKYWAPYLKVLQLCKTTKECGYNEPDEEECDSGGCPLSFLNGKRNNMSLVLGDWRILLKTMDGFNYLIMVTSGFNSDANPLIYVDLNGGAKPNTMGKDVFLLERFVDGEKGGVVLPYGHDKTDEQISASCKKSGMGHYCAEKIRRAGWQIDKSYPW